MDLVNGKTLYCPECGRPLTKYSGDTVNGETVQVSAYCETCDKHYHWIACIKHTVYGFSHYFPQMNQRFKRYFYELDKIHLRIEEVEVEE